MKKQIHSLMKLSPDPCTYASCSSFVDNTQVGVEIELEQVRGLNNVDTDFYNYWRLTEDGSLRDNGVEFVMTRPFAGKDLETALSIFNQYITNNEEVKVACSERTSVHVHIDVRDLTIEQLIRFFCVYLIFESALFKVAGKERENNIFCTSMQNAEGSAWKIGLLRGGKLDARRMISGMTKYSACNLLAVSKYGSMEFRHHSGTYDTNEISKWINILLQIRKYAVGNDIPVEDILSNISDDGAERVFNEVFGDYAHELYYPEISFDMFNGLRLAQDVIYAELLAKGLKSYPKIKSGEDDSPFSRFYKSQDSTRYKEVGIKYIDGILGNVTPTKDDGTVVFTVDGSSVAITLSGTLNLE